MRRARGRGLCAGRAGRQAAWHKGMHGPCTAQSLVPDWAGQSGRKKKKKKKRQSLFDGGHRKGRERKLGLGHSSSDRARQEDWLGRPGQGGLEKI